MSTVPIPGRNNIDTQMAVHTVTQNTDVSLSQEFQKYIFNESRKHGIIDHGSKKNPIKQRWKNRKYYVQHNKYVKYQDIKMYLRKKLVSRLKFLGSHNKPHGVRGLVQHYHTSFHPKLVHVTYEIRRIPYAYNLCTYSIDQPCIPSFPAHQKSRSQPIRYCKYWTLLKLLNYHIRQHPVNKLAEKIQDVLDSISDNMTALVQKGQYYAINTTDTSTMG